MFSPSLHTYKKLIAYLMSLVETRYQSYRQLTVYSNLDIIWQKLDSMKQYRLWFLLNVVYTV